MKKTNKTPESSIKTYLILIILLASSYFLAKTTGSIIFTAIFLGTANYAFWFLVRKMGDVK